MKTVLWTTEETRYLDRIRLLDPIDRAVHWINERERVRMRKEFDDAKPWTDDPIIQRFRFCNIRRMDDKVSRWLMNNWYRPYFNHPLMVPAVALARFINLPSSLELVTDLIFKSDYWKRDGIAAILRDHKEAGNTLYNNAYMVRGNDGVDKVASVLEHYIDSLRNDGSDSWLHPCRDSMEETCKRISNRYGFGSFMAGQITADLRWAIAGDWTDTMSWAAQGPGSTRGLHRIAGRDYTKSLKPTKFLAELLDLSDALRERLSVRIFAKLELHDVQNTMCEFDKYERVLWGQGKPKQSYKPAT